MKKTDKFAVILSVTMYANAFASVYNVLGPWSGSGAAMINMATLGNGMSVSSITIA
jgi:hypothetical protein